MAFLEQFSAEERALIISVPFRAGHWVSVVDDTGGAKAGDAEREALENIITERARGMFESAFVHEVMAETCTRQDDWKAWSDNMDTVLEDCAKVVGIIGGKLAERDLDAYRMNVMGIGLAVAKAFREMDDGAPFFVKLQTKILLFIEAIVRLIKRDRSYDAESALNISFEEDVALTKLSKALHPGT